MTSNTQTTQWEMIEEAALQPSITDEQAESLLQADILEKKQLRKDQRLVDCGRWSYFFDAHTGRKSAFLFKCGYFRECDKCRVDRANNEFKAIRELSYHQTLAALKVPQKSATKILRDVDKKDYVRYPQKDHDLIIISQDVVNTLPPVEKEKVDYKWLEKQNWETIINTPSGRNRSGKIHLPAPVDTEEKFAIIDSRQIVSNASRQVVENAMDIAIQKTAHFDPKDAEEVEGHLKKRTYLAVSFLKKSGYIVNTYEKKQKLILSKISWDNNRIYTESFTKSPSNSIGNRSNIPKRDISHVYA